MRRLTLVVVAGLSLVAIGPYAGCTDDGGEASPAHDPSVDAGDASFGDVVSSDSSDGGATFDAATAPTLSMSFARAAGAILVTLRVGGGETDAETVPTLVVSSGVLSAVSRGAVAGEFTATLTPDATDVEITITASAFGVSVTKVALVIANIDDSLGQPEAVPGLVNTAGVEDGANVSPDGNWLIVATYTPIDVYTCANKGVTMTEPSCASIVGPWTGPARPNMLGASRIHGNTYDSHCPSVGLTALQTVSFFPTAAYVFRRQPDDSFGEPRVLGVSADGCLGPYGYSFANAPSGNVAGVVFAHDDPFDVPDTSEDVYFLQLALGQDNIWGTYGLDDAGAPKLSAMTAVKLPPVLPTRQGNPAFANGVLAWDNEHLAADQRVLYFASQSGTLPNVTAGDAGVFGMNVAGKEHIQPAFDGDDLYWYGDGIRRARRQTTGDLSSPATWGTPVALLAPAGTGTIVATGEPTVANLPGGKKELYFVYIKKTATGLDGAVGRVPFQ